MSNSPTEKSLPPEMSESILISLDMVGKIVAPSGSEPIIVGFDETSLLVSGWAVDKQAKKTLNKIFVCLDEISYQVTSTIKRLDVADHLKNPKFKFSGFSIELPLEGITFGWHRISITVLCHDGRLLQGLSPIRIFRQDKRKGIDKIVLYELRQLLTRPIRFSQRTRAAWGHIINRGLGSFLEGYLNRMYRTPHGVEKAVDEPSISTITQHILMTVDMVGKSSVASADQPILVSNNEKSLLVTGWAIDRQSNSPFKEVYVCLNNAPYLATYGISRWDVANHFSNPAYIASGFRVEIPLEESIFGRHILSVTVVNKDGTKNEVLSPIWIFRQGKKRSLSELVIFEIQRFRTNPGRFAQRARAAFLYILRHGLESFWSAYLNRMYRASDNVQKYKQWIIRHESPQRLKEQRSFQFKIRLLISIIVPVYETPEPMLVAMIRSVIDQTYSSWELCIADGKSSSGRISKILKNFQDKDHRIKVIFLTENQGISGNSNAAISIASGDFIAFLDHDDLLAPDALFEIVKRINEQGEVDLVYSDEDNVSSDGKLRMSPYFKPDYSPDTLRSGNYISHFLAIRKSLGDQLGWLRPEFDGAQDYDLVLRASEIARVIVHVPRVLYHWRAHEGSTALGLKVKPYAEHAGKRALEDHLRRTGFTGEVEDGAGPYLYKIKFSLKTQPLVSIIVPNKDQADVLECCLRSVLDKSTYKNFEIIIVENKSQQHKTFALYKKLLRDSRVRVIAWGQPFNFSALNNFAAKSARGEVLLFLNNDTEVINADWLERMLEYAIRPDVGAVGAKLYYPDKTIQHGGVIVGLGGVAGHVLKYHVGHQEEFARLNRVQNYSAVTAACLMMRRQVFDEVGGFNEALEVAFNDVDLCLKVREKRYLIVWTPCAELFHHESKSRGSDNTPEKMARFGKEITTFKDRWSDFLLQGDPFYNPNLTLDAEDFSIKDI